MISEYESGNVVFHDMLEYNQKAMNLFLKGGRQKYLDVRQLYQI